MATIQSYPELAKPAQLKDDCRGSETVQADSWREALDAHEPIRTLAEFFQLDDGEILCGYFDGFSGKHPDPAIDTRSYSHGWRNGMIESDRWPEDKAYRDLERAIRVKRHAH